MALAVVTTTKKLKYYFQSHNMVVRTNQPLRKAIQRPKTSGRLVHWSIQLSVHDSRYEPRPTLKAQALADFVAEITPGKAEEFVPELVWKLHVDGALNEKGEGAGAILKGPKKVKMEYGVNIQFTASNNAAEYEALIAGLGLALEIQTKILKIYSDSQLVVNQVKGEYHAKEAGMIEYLEKVTKLLRQLEAQGGQWEIMQIPREENTDADAIAKSASELGDLFTKMQLKETLASPSIKKEAIMTIDEADSWMTPLIKYLDQGELLIDNVEAIRTIRKSANYSCHNGVLYRTSLNHPWSRCVSPKSGSSIHKKIHEGICAAHEGAVTIARKTMLQGYYWPTIKEDAKALVKKCDKGQRHDNVNHRPAVPKGSLESPCPFATWGIDIVGPFESGRNQMKFLIVAVEHFTKWVEVAPVSTITAARVEEFFKNEVICRFGIPHTIVADNGKTTPRKGTGETPIRLAYGTEAVIPVEIEGRRHQAGIRAVAYKKQAAKYHNRRINSREFQVGDLVLRNAEIGRGIAGVNKMQLNWEGPYIVEETTGKGAYKLKTMTGSMVPRYWNVEHLRKYYQ
ncbi:uncharacterized protein LOC126656993 [Mercurialis annua]|uniref:uncharacterized protein LOC126656993 n=1 Tax=Mercurialis annua TaxID=3986 RepID=UPI00215FDF61|nr:uncharacterized protein LOC126656993 [Mercurialis annua]